MNQTSFKKAYETGMLVQILRQHHITYRRSKDGRLWALEVIYYPDRRSSQWVDVTHWSMRRLLQWLGY